MDLTPAYKKEYKNIISEFIKQRVKACKVGKAIVGLSGGLDSSVVAKLMVDTLGKDIPLAIIMPVAKFNDTELAVEVAKELGINYKIIDLEKSFNSLLNIYLKDTGIAIDEVDKITKGNVAARLRMVTLYFYANLYKGFVVGTSNRTEILIGYFTKFGDGASDVLPIGDLYKTQVISLAKDIGVPERVISMPPSAGFYEGQTDESELGIDYSVLDKILYGLKLKLKIEEIAKNLDIDVKEVQRIKKMIRETSHKREGAITPKIGEG